MKAEAQNQNSDRSFLLFASCVPVRGARRSVICDLQRQSFRFIPNGLYEILVQHRGKKPSEIKAAYEHEFDEEIDEYLSYLMDEEFGFWTNEPENFPNLDLTWQRPERITNAIIDIDSESDHDYHRIFCELDDLGCKALELRFFHTTPNCNIYQVLNNTNLSRLRSIALIASWSEELSPESLEKLVRDHQRVQSILVHSAPKALRVELKQGVVLHYRREVVDSPSCCGQIHPGYFVTNIETFSEAQDYNTCLNCKISIDVRGEIRNCPSLPRSFGNIKLVSLHSAVAHRDFSALWSINKDQIDVCKDCEFRYICTDCRAYLVNPADLYSKPVNCGYDPYTAQWADRNQDSKISPSVREP